MPSSVLCDAVIRQNAVWMLTLLSSRAPRSLLLPKSKPESPFRFLFCSPPSKSSSLKKTKTHIHLNRSKSVQWIHWQNHRAWDDAFEFPKSFRTLFHYSPPVYGTNIDYSSLSLIEVVYVCRRAPVSLSLSLSFFLYCVWMCIGGSYLPFLYTTHSILPCVFFVFSLSLIFPSSHLAQWGALSSART